MFFEPLERRRMLCAAIDAAPADAPLDESDLGMAATKVDGVAARESLSWTTGASMPQRREEGASAVLNGRLYAFGGFYDHTFDATGRVDAYNPATNTWQQRASMPEAITHAPTVVIGGEAWIFGGYVGKDPGPATRRVYIYNPNTNAWRRGPDMPFARGAAAAARVDDRVYVFGGRDLTRTADVPQTFEYNIKSGAWAVRADLPNPRNHIAGAAVGGKVFAIGGQHNEASAAVNQRSVHRYDPVTNTWTAVASLPFAMSHNVASTFEYQGRIITVGGETSHNVATSAVLLYEPWRNRWRTLTSLPQERRAPQAGIINGKLYVAGGSIRGGQRSDLYISNVLDGVI